MRDVAVVSFAQSVSPKDAGRNEVEILMPVVAEALAGSGLKHEEIGFTCSGSNDYLIGGPFSFVAALDSVGAWPPISESHVEMDGAWALYEAWIKLQTGHIDAALIYSFGKNSMTDIGELTALALDPYSLQPLWPDHISLAALQARAYLDASGKTERDLAEVAARSRRAARSNPHAILSGDATAEQLLQSDFAVAPLRTSDTPPITDGAAAIILAAGDFATRSGKKPAWITGLDHRIEAHQPGARDLTRSVSTRLAGEKAGVGTRPVDVAELHAAFSHEELILREALSLGDDVNVNPSGGPLAANPWMATGLIRIGEAASHIQSGGAQRVVAHATAGPCLQQNLVCVMEARS
jgi:acetyl-CoA acetyltransferase